MNINHLIAISGTKGSGKTEASEMLQYCLSVPKIFRQYWIYKRFGKFFHKSWKILAFADPLKKMLAALLNIPIEKFNDRDFKENWGVDLKWLHVLRLEHMKEELKLSDSKFNKMTKNLDSSIVNYCLSIRQLMQYFGTSIMRTYFGNKVWIISTLKHSEENTIISDCRFINEATAIKNNNGKIIYISRKNAPFSQHQSEKEMEWMLHNNFYDYIIENNSNSIEDLFNKIKDICDDI